GVERAAGEVEVVAVQALPEVGRGRPDLDQVVALPRAAERDRVLAEEGVHVARLVRLARAALGRLRGGAGDRRGPPREVLRPGGGERSARADERAEEAEREDRAAQTPGRQGGAIVPRAVCARPDPGPYSPRGRGRPEARRRRQRDHPAARGRGADRALPG